MMVVMVMFLLNTPVPDLQVLVSATIPMRSLATGIVADPEPAGAFIIAPGRRQRMKNAPFRS